ncbi:hypothetical protein O181_062337 [Austropuccinia psidii MF-1]|uniref:Uncharacterized protein n=1 Tax=Austropuccinia psidii MF-1 TaxID=1389203 RepID=A0A9Q3EMG6_9BASI|nr:hypothetical protein [Austropuccinia psidii MF-1]
MEETIQSNQIDLIKEEERLVPELVGLPEERKLWRIPEDPPIPQGNVLRVELLPSGSQRNISVPVQRLVQGRKGRGLGNSFKPLAGRHELLFTHQELSGSGEDHRALRSMESLVLQGKGKNVQNWLKNQSLLSIEQKKELELTPYLEKDRPVASTSFKTAPEQPNDKPKRPQKKQRGPRKNQGKVNWHRPYPQGYSIPKLEP